jgi:all-trans-retinol 13,14-reductase
MNRKYDAIVIGSGIGGMACAAALAKSGMKILILEQHYVAGGMTHTFKRKKFEFDVGVHALGEMQENRMPGKIMNWLSSGNLKMLEYGRPYETFVFSDGYKFEYPNDKDKFKELLIKDFPKEEESIHKYFDLVNFVGKQAKSHFISRLLPVWVDKCFSSIIKRNFNKYANRTLKSVLEEYFDSEKLKGVISGQWGYYGAVPSRASFFIHAIVTRHFWEGAFYPEGGSSKIAETFLTSVTDNGGEVLLRNSVEEVLMKGGKAIGVKSNKGEYFSDIVISAVGAKATVDKIIPNEYKKKEWAQNISSLTQSPPHLCLYLGFEGNIKELGATESNQWWCDTYDFENGFWDVKDKESYPPILYISFPGLKNPEIKIDQNQTCEVVTFVDWDDFSKWKDTKVGRRGDEYKEFKEHIKERMMEKMRKSHPELMEKCVYSELSTPLSTDQFCRPPRGAIYGLEPTIKRWQTTELRPKTPIKNFYMTGGDIGTLGVIGAMIGGVLTAAKIDKSILRWFK